jgi:hypothetical protein
VIVEQGALGGAEDAVEGAEVKPPRRAAKPAKKSAARKPAAKAAKKAPAKKPASKKPAAKKKKES